MSGPSIPRKHLADKRIDKDQEYWLYHRCIEDSVDIFADSEEDFDESARVQVLNIGDLEIVDKRHWTKKSEATSISPTNLESCSQSEDAPKYFKNFDVAEILKKEQCAFLNFDVQFKKINNFNFDKEIECFESDKRFQVKTLRHSPKQVIIDGTKFQNALNAYGNQFQATTIVVVLTEIEDHSVNVIINSIFQENPKTRSTDFKFWKSLISNSTSVYDAIQSIVTEFSENCKKIELINLSADLLENKPPFEMLKDAQEWEKNLPKTIFQNRLDFQISANSVDLSKVGLKVELSHICLGTKKETSVFPEKGNVNACDFCNDRKLSHELFVMMENKLKCTNCLRKTFFRAFEMHIFPIDLQMKTVNEFDHLPIFIPLIILDMYVHKVAQKSCDDKVIEQCRQCRQFIQFDFVNNNNHNVSCPCGYTWCQKCKLSPHWPMDCTTFKNWQRKWFLKYSMSKARGTGSEFLLQVTCSCKKQIFYTFGPIELIKSPCCNAKIDISEIWDGWRRDDRDLPEELRDKIIRVHPDARELVVNFHLKKQGIRVVSKVSKIPNMKKSVLEVCGEAHDLRYSTEFHNKLNKDCKQLAKSGITNAGLIKNVMSTALYLTENVTAWMYETDLIDKNLRQGLEKMTSNRQMLMEQMKNREIKYIMQTLEKLQGSVNFLIKTVKAHLETDKT
uniref:IBR domain-containing protein n=1 Tax=Caenorhabditis japonica TaxID=281687 RepID=A0A8R1HUN2_CAEJA